MAVTTEKINLVISVNGNQAQQQLHSLNEEAAAIRAEMKGMKKNTQEYIDASARLSSVNQKIDEMRSSMDLSLLSIKELKKEMRSMTALRDSLPPTSEEFKRLSERINQAKNRMTELQEGGNWLTRAFKGMKNEIIAMGALAIGTLGLDFLIGKIGDVIQRNAELSDSFANVRKVTGLTAQEMEELNKSLSSIDTRTSKKELLELAEEAGRLGFTGVENVRAFTEEANKMQVALGDDLTIEQIREVGKMTNVYKVGAETGKDFAGAMNALGSAINEVAASGANQAGFLVDYLKRQAGVSSQTKVTAANNLAYAATFDEIGQSVEVSATAMNKVWMDMYKNTGQYAKIAGVNINEFKEILNTDANQAMMLFLKGLNNTNGGFDIMLEMLGDLEVGGARGAQAILALAANTDRLAEIQGTSNKALQEATSLNDEYALKNDNLAGKISKLQKQIASLFVSDTFNNWITSGVNALIDFVKWLKETGKWIEKNMVWFKAIGSVVLGYVGALASLLAIEKIRIVVQKTNLSLQQIRVMWLNREAIAVNLVANAIEFFSGKIVINTAVTEANTVALTKWQKLFNAVRFLNPWALAIAGAVAFIAIIKAVRDNYEKMRNEFINKTVEIKFTSKANEVKKELDSKLQEIKSDIESDDKNRINLSIGIADKSIQDIQKQMAGYLNVIANSSSEINRLEQEDKKRNKGGGTLNNSEQAQLIANKKVKEVAIQMMVELTEKQNEFVKTKGQLNAKLTQLDQKRTEEIKADADKKKSAYQDYLKEVQKFYDELKKLKQSAERAEIEIIQDEQERSLKLLEFDKELVNKNINEKRDALIKEANQLKQGKDVIEKIHNDSFMLIVANENKFQKDRQNLIEKYAKETQEKERQLEIKKLNESIEQQKFYWTKQFETGKISKQEYTRAITDLDIMEKTWLLDIAQKYGVDVTKLELELSNMRIKIANDEAAKKQQLAEREADYRVEQARNKVNKLSSNPLAMGLKDANKELQNAEFERLKIFYKGQLDLLDEHSEEFAAKKREWFTKIAENDVAFEQAELERKTAIASETLNIFGQMASELFNLRANKLSEELNLAQSNYQKESDYLQTQLNQRRITEYDYLKKKEALDAQIQEKERKIKLKQARAEKAQAAFNIGINTAQAIMGIWAQFPKFDFGITAGIMSGIVGALGAVQLATVLAAKVPQYYTGGYANVKGKQDNQNYSAKLLPGFEAGFLTNPSLVLAGEKKPEYFVNGDVLENPSVKYVVDGIDRLTNGHINQIEFDKMLAMPALQQRYMGGYVSNTSSQPIYASSNSTDNNNNQDLLLLFGEALNKLNNHLDNGIKASAFINDQTIVDFNDRSQFLDEIKKSSS